MLPKISYFNEFVVAFLLLSCPVYSYLHGEWNPVLCWWGNGWWPHS